MWIHYSKTFNTHWKTRGKSKFGFERTAVSNFKSKRHEGSGNKLVDYSRAPCLGADQKHVGSGNEIETCCKLVTLDKVVLSSLPNCAH